MELKELLIELQGERDWYFVFISKRGDEKKLYPDEEITLKCLEKRHIDFYEVVNYNGIVPRIVLKDKQENKKC